jgi:hypothetical protein
LRPLRGPTPHANANREPRIRGGDKRQRVAALRRTENVRRIEAGKKLIEPARRFLRVNGKWCKANITQRTKRDIQKVMKLASADDPAAALEAERAARRESMKDASQSKSLGRLVARLVKLNLDQKRVEAGEAGDILWTAWCAENISDIKLRRIRQLIQIGRDETTQSALNEKTRKAMVGSRDATPKSPARKTLDSSLKKLATTPTPTKVVLRACALATAHSASIADVIRPAPETNTHHLMRFWSRRR